MLTSNECLVLPVSELHSVDCVFLPTNLVLCSIYSGLILAV